MFVVTQIRAIFLCAFLIVSQCVFINVARISIYMWEGGGQPLRWVGNRMARDDTGGGECINTFLMASTCRVLSVSNKREGCGLFLECQITELFFLPSLFFSAHPALQFRGKTFFFLPFPLVLLYAQAYVCVCVYTQALYVPPLLLQLIGNWARELQDHNIVYIISIYTHIASALVLWCFYTHMGLPFFFWFGRAIRTRVPDRRIPKDISSTCWIAMCDSSAYIHSFSHGHCWATRRRGIPPSLSILAVVGFLYTKCRL